ncbi:MAG TPA: hypothetical protein VLF79_02815 [Candidatus Saccharimonadales bacterium]|nr:hypothetical protein [Candidatus Saccharimonadales bacterium]
MVVAIGAGSDSIEGIGAREFTASEGLLVVAYPPIYDEATMTASVRREAARIHQPGGEQIKAAHDRARDMFLGQLADYQDRLFYPNGVPSEQLRATVEQLRFQTSVIQEAVRLETIS